MPDPQHCRNQGSPRGDWISRHLACLLIMSFTEKHRVENSPPRDEADYASTILLGKRYHWHDVKLATRGFGADFVVGENTYATVYKGNTLEGSTIAVKRLKSARSRPKHEFESDVVCIARTSHKNVAKLLGYSSTFLEKVFVFEYFRQGSLDAMLHGDSTGPVFLDWDKRKAIMLGVAEGLNYLHNLKPCIIHGALKSSNIMLTDDLTPKLIDFHIGRPVIRKKPTQIPDIEWAMGYMAPELALKVEIPCVKSDCYSYGFLLLEMITGRRPWRLLTAANSGNLKQKEWVRASLAANVQSLVDPQMTHLPSQSHPPLWEVKKILELAILCMEDHPRRRPSMDGIIQFLSEELLVTNRSQELDHLFIELDVSSEHETNEAASTGSSEPSMPVSKLKGKADMGNSGVMASKMAESMSPPFKSPSNAANR